MSLFLWGVAGLTLLYTLNRLRLLHASIQLAKQSGLPYVVVPFFFLSRTWLVQSWIWLPLIYKLPRSLTFPWAYLLDNEWSNRLKREPFDYFKSDAFLIVSPQRISLFVADPEAISQITTRRNDFPKPIQFYHSVDIYGKNVVSTEGQVWRHHRKITSPPFTEKNNHMVWTESLHQARSMVESWLSPKEKVSKPVSDIGAAAMRLSLHIISRAGFGVRLLWPHEETKSGGKAGNVPEGHTMTYKDALSSLLENIIQAFLLPGWLLKNSPLEANKVAYEAMTEWKQYMQEMYDDKKQQVASGQLTEGMDLMGALVRGAGVTSSASDAEKGKASGQLLTDDEILGNAFVFILAGHETAANTIHCSLLQLALNPTTQIRLQKDLDNIFGSRPVSEWSYDDDVPKLFGSMAGAVMNESLRLFPPVVGIPKCIPKTSSPQPLTMAGKRLTVPSGTFITLDVIAAHLHPAHWPNLAGPGASAAAIDEDLRSFKPERWLLDSSSSSSASQQQQQQQEEEDNADPESYGGPSSADTSPSLFRPKRGSYLPFSDGARACLGRRFAQVEVLAVLAVVMREWSVELAVDEVLDDVKWPYPGKEEIIEINPGTTKGKDDEERWSKARERVQELVKTNMSTVITLQLRGARVPLRFVRRGNERYRF